MKGLTASITRGLPVNSIMPACDNSGAKMVKIFNVQGLKTRKGRKPSAAIGDLVMGSVVKGRPDMRKQVVFAVIVRQRQSYKRADGSRIKFEENALVVLK